MKINGLAHVGVFVRDLDVSRRFYEDVLNFETVWSFVNDGTPIAFVRNGSCTIELIQLDEVRERKDGIVDHVAFAVTDIEEVQKTLLAKGITFETDEVVSCPACFPNGSRWLLFRGPDGERLEVAEVL